jgi:regulator of sigma D
MQLRYERIEEIGIAVDAWLGGLRQHSVTLFWKVVQSQTIRYRLLPINVNWLCKFCECITT